MASKHKLKSGKYQVRWREDGKNRAKTVPSNRAANRKIREIEERQAEGKRGEPDPVCERPELTEIHRAYLRAQSRRLAPLTIRVAANFLEIWENWLKERFKGERLDPEILTRALLGEFYEWLLTSGVRGKRKASSANHMIRRIWLMWEWAEDDERYEPFMPRPRRIKLRSTTHRYPVAPTWAEMDAMIRSLSGLNKRAAIIMRFTGLRPNQAAMLKWSDVALSECLLEVRGELGKSAKERGGRIVPISQHLARLMASWEKGGIYVAVKSPDQCPSNRRKAFHKAWRSTGCNPRIYQGAPAKAFRRGLQSGLKRAGADDEAVKYLVGHDRGLRSHYVDPWSLPLVPAVQLIPSMEPE